MVLELEVWQDYGGSTADPPSYRLGMNQDDV